MTDFAVFLTVRRGTSFDRLLRSLMTRRKHINYRQESGSRDAGLLSKVPAQPSVLTTAANKATFSSTLVCLFVCLC